MRIKTNENNINLYNCFMLKHLFDIVIDRVCLIAPKAYNSDCILNVTIDEIRQLSALCIGHDYDESGTKLFLCKIKIT